MLRRADLALRHEERIPTSLSADALWQLLVEAFEDSKQSPLWPEGLETLRALDGVHAGAQLAATYKMGPARARQVYTLPIVDPSARVLSYETGPDHPLSGGGRVSIEPVGAGARLCWRFDYELRLRLSSPAIALFIKLWFEARFFEALKNNLRRCEQRAPHEEAAPLRSERAAGAA